MLAQMFLEAYWKVKEMESYYHALIQNWRPEKVTKLSH